MPDPFPLSLKTYRDTGTKVYCRYGLEWPSVDSDCEPKAAKLAIELEAFKIGGTDKHADGTENESGKSKYAHFRSLAEIFWPDVVWHRWMIWVAQAMCEERMLTLTGSASSGKTAAMVLYGLISYIADAENTIIFVLTTTVKDAEQRIWKEYTQRFNELKAGGLKGFKMVNREHYIGMEDSTKGAGKGTSIQLVAAGDKDRDNALQKLQGVKASKGKIIVQTDEAQDCSASVFAAFSNLKNNPSFEAQITGNAANRFDAHGMACEPIDGWDSITENDKEWPIKIEGIVGNCLHLDGFDSPNFDDRNDVTWEEDGTPNFDNYDITIKDRYSFIKRTEIVMSDLLDKGIRDPAFWRQCRGFWAPSDVEDDTIYPTADLARYKALKREVQWLYPPTPGLGVDPAKGGQDRFIVVHGMYGMAKVAGEDRAFPVVFCNEVFDLKIEGATDESSQSRNMVLRVKEIADRLGIPPENVAVDASSLDAIGDHFRDIWSRKILFVDFNGTPSDMLFDRDSPKTCKEMFDRKVSELWFIGRLFMRKMQLAGITLTMAKEMSKRKYEKKAGGKIRVETKEEMKKNTNGVSPDESEGFFLLLNLFRERFGAIPGGGIIKQNPWAELFGQKTIDTRAVTQLKQLKTQRQFSTPPEPKGNQKSQLQQWLHQTGRRN